MTATPIAKYAAFSRTAIAMTFSGGMDGRPSLMIVARKEWP